MSCFPSASVSLSPPPAVPHSAADHKARPPPPPTPDPHPPALPIGPPLPLPLRPRAPSPSLLPRSSPSPQTTRRPKRGSNNNPGATIYGSHRKSHPPPLPRSTASQS